MRWKKKKKEFAAKILRFYDKILENLPNFKFTRPDLK